MHIALAVFMASLPVSALASMLISEVSYDPPGTDSKREWIEIENSGGAAVAISSIRFIEGGVAHKITAYGISSDVIDAGSFAVLADDPATFLIDYPQYSGLLYDSAFSLANTGEVLAVSVDGLETDSISYVSADGAAGTGASLMRVNSSFMPARPTPGSQNVSEFWDGDSKDVQETETSTNSSSTATSTHSSPVAVSKFVSKASFQVDAGRNRAVAVNVPIEFEVGATSASEAFGARWSFGDGDFVYGTRVEHQYGRPGNYVVVLNARARESKERSVDRFIVEVFEPEIEIETEEEGYVVRNVSGRELNVGGFRYTQEGDAGRYRTWEEDTILLNEGELFVPSNNPQTCGLKISYPNGVGLLPIGCAIAVQLPP